MPSYDDYEGFDRDDLVGIALGVEDPLYLEQVHYRCLREHTIDESGVDGQLTMLLNKEVDSEAPEDIDVDFADIMPEDDDLTIDGIDAEDLGDSDFDIESGEADDDIDLLDYIDMEDTYDEDF